MQAFVREGKLSAGHARALITADNPAALARRVIEGNLSVRETEKLVKAPDVRRGQATAASRDRRRTPIPGRWNSDLSAALGMKVTIDHKGGSGQVQIGYKDLDQLDRICQTLSAQRDLTLRRSVGSR